MQASRGDPPLFMWKLDHPPDVENMLNNLFSNELIFKIKGCQNRQQGSGMPKSFPRPLQKRGVLGTGFYESLGF
jgi:hypothetical protein